MSRVSDKPSGVTPGGQREISMTAKKTETEKSSVLTDKEAFDRDEAASEKLKHMSDKSAGGQDASSAKQPERKKK